MALFATHVRYAMDRAASLNVSDSAAYYSGVVYPDSRYVTKLPRSVTHQKTDAVPTNDFERGRLMHVAYDDLVGPMYVAHSPWPDTKVTAASPSWIYTTAEKIVEDQLSCAELGANLEMLRSLVTADPVNGEDPALLQTYYDLVRNFYAHVPTVEGYEGLLLAFGLPTDIAQKTVRTAREISDDPVRVRLIASFYPEALKTRV